MYVHDVARYIQLNSPWDLIWDKLMEYIITMILNYRPICVTLLKIIQFFVKVYWLIHSYSFLERVKLRVKSVEKNLFRKVMLDAILFLNIVECSSKLIVIYVARHLKTNKVLGPIQEAPIIYTRWTQSLSYNINKLQCFLSNYFKTSSS